jgi:hypothetical protein
MSLGRRRGTFDGESCSRTANLAWDDMTDRLQTTDWLEEDDDEDDGEESVDSLSCWAGLDRERSDDSDCSEWIDNSGDDGASELSVELSTASRAELFPLLLRV